MKNKLCQFNIYYTERKKLEKERHQLMREQEDLAIQMTEFQKLRDSTIFTMSKIYVSTAQTLHVKFLLIESYLHSPPNHGYLSPEFSDQVQTII